MASYNRGMKVLNLCGGVKGTVVDDAMQRAPVFVFEDARRPGFTRWVEVHQETSKSEAAEATSALAKLQ